MSKKINTIDNDGNIISEEIVDADYEEIQTEISIDENPDLAYIDDYNYSNEKITDEEYDVFGNKKEKKPFNKMFIIVPIVILLLILLGFWISSVTSNKYTINTKSMDIKIKETQVIEITAKDKVKEKITFSSENEKIATVDKNGKVTGISVGNTTIYVGLEGKKSKKVNIQVKTNKEELVLEKTNIRLEKDKTYQLKVKNVLEEDIFSWKSLNEEIAIVDQFGVVTGIHAGTTTITVTESDGRKVSTRVTVVSDEILITKLLLEDKTIAVGEKLTLVPNIEPEEALGIFTWTSSNPNIATIDEQGNVLGIANGTTIITVQSHNGRRTTARLTVDETLPVGIGINGCSGNLTMNKELDLNITYSPVNTNSTITWSSSNNNIATVYDGRVTGKNTGTVTITATTENGKKATCKLTVSPIAVDSLSATVSNISLNQNETKKVSITFNPSNSKEYYTINWKSLNTKIATVTSEGIIKGINPGTTTITASAGGKTVSITVTVKSTFATSIQLTGCVSSIEAGEAFTLKATALPSTADNKTISWSSSNTTVANVSSGKVIGKALGVATITAKTSNGIEAICVVNVTKPQVTELSLPSDSIRVKVNGTKIITAKTNLSIDLFNKYHEASWKASNPDLISITPSTSNELSMTVKGLKKGTTKLYIIAGGRTDYMEIIVE